MLFRAPLHFYVSWEERVSVFKPCVNALPSSTSFLPTSRWRPPCISIWCQCSSELHFISTKNWKRSVGKCICVNALPSSTSFLPRPVRNPWFTRLSEACFAGIFQNILINSLFQGVFMSWKNYSCFSTILVIFSNSYWIYLWRFSFIFPLPVNSIISVVYDVKQKHTADLHFHYL